MLSYRSRFPPISSRSTISFESDDRLLGTAAKLYPREKIKLPNIISIKKPNESPRKESSNVPKPNRIGDVKSPVIQSSSISVSKEEAKSSLKAFRIVHLRSTMDDSDKEFDQTIAPLRENVESIISYVDSQGLIDFVTKVQKDRILFFTTSNNRSIIKTIDKFNQIEAIFCVNCLRPEDEQQMKSLSMKIKNRSEIVRYVAEAKNLKQMLRSNGNSMINTNSVDLSSFVLNQFLTEKINELNDDDNEAIEDFFRSTREAYKNESDRIKYLDKIQFDYSPEKAIRLYTQSCFIHNDINMALRTQDINKIVIMRRWIRDLTKRIEQLDGPPSETKLLFRGQILSTTEFNELCLRGGGSLHPFYPFISTSIDYEVAERFAEGGRCSSCPVRVAIIFRIHIDSNNFSSSKFAFIAHESFYGNEENEVLFSTHTIFRVGWIKQLNENLWQIDLFCDIDENKRIQQLKNEIQTRIGSSVGWDSIVKIILECRTSQITEELIDNVINKISINGQGRQFGHRFHFMAYKKIFEGDYVKALDYFRRALEDYRKESKISDRTLSKIHSDIARTAMITKKYDEALLNYQNLVKILEKSTSTDLIQLEEVYRRIARIYYEKRDFQRCLNVIKQFSSREKSLELQSLIEDLEYGVGIPPTNTIEDEQLLSGEKKKLQQIEPKGSKYRVELIEQHRIIGQLHYKMKNYRSALESYKNLLMLLQRFRPERFENFAEAFERIGHMYEKMKDDSKARIAYKEAITMLKKSTHPDSSLVSKYQENLRSVGKLPEYFSMKDIDFDFNSSPEQFFRIDECHVIFL